MLLQFSVAVMFIQSFFETISSSPCCFLGLFEVTEKGMQETCSPLNHILTLT